MLINIYEALKRDHLEVKSLLNELVSLKNDDDYGYILLEEIRRHLIPHSRAVMQIKKSSSMATMNM